MRIPTEAQSIPLESAYLCANCDTVGDSAIACSHCGDKSAILSLQSIMDRQVEKIMGGQNA